MTDNFDIVIAGAGPAGLSAAQACAARGLRTLLLEQNWQIGAPTRTSGGSFIKDLEALGLPAHLWHPVSNCRFVSPSHSVSFEHSPPELCIIDVQSTWQHLAQQAAEAGAVIRLATTAQAPRMNAARVVGLTAKDARGRLYEIRSEIVIDACGYRAPLLREAGIHPGFQRFGVGAEYDLYAPNYNRHEAVLIVGSQIAPCGYAWAFPWGDRRVRVGVGVIHADSPANPHDYLDTLISNSTRFGLNLTGAQPVEYHQGLIPSDGVAERFTGDGIMGVGDAAGHPSALLGEGIRWAILAGRLAGQVAADAIRTGNTSASFLKRLETRWRAQHGINLRIAHEINRKMARWDDEKWDRRTKLLSLLTPDQFLQALRTNFVARWPLDLIRKHPTLLKEGIGQILQRTAKTGGRTV